jgi:hypothetical protein
MPALVSDIVNAVINELSQVPGIATQVYASGRIQQHVQDALLLELEEMWWPDYMTYLGPIPLDGTTGSLTQDLIGPLAKITEYHDIAAVFRDGTNRKLRELPQSINPLALTSGLSTYYIAPDYRVPGRPFIVYPPDSVFGVVVWARQRPRLPLDLTDTVYLDRLLLQYDACWMYAVDDGTIPAQVNKFQVLAQNRRRMIKAAFAQHPIELDPRYPGGGDIGITGDSSEFFVLDQDSLA